MSNIKNQKSGAGYTLIEILVAVAIFFIILAGPASFLTTSLRAQMRALSSREVVDNSSYALEYVSRVLRMARRAPSQTCIPASRNYNNPGADVSKIRFLNYQFLCQEFSLSNGQLGEKKSTDDSSSNFGSFVPLISDDLEITLLKFQLSGETQTDDLQPKVTIVFESRKKGQAATKTIIQTSVSQRDLDVE